MEWIWELLSRNPWLFLIVLGVVGQVFTPNPKKRKQAREREREARRQQQQQQGGGKTRTEPDEIAKRIRELFEGKSSPAEDMDEGFLEEAPVLAMPPAVTPAVVEAQPVKSEVERSHRAVDGAFFHPIALSRETLPEDNVAPLYAWDLEAPKHQWTIPEEQAHGAYTLDPRVAIQTMLVLGPPRALASYDEDPLLSRYQSLL